MKLTERKVLAVLRRQGYKLTPQRRAVIRVVVSSPDHLTPIAIYHKLHQEHPDTGLVTVYRTLKILDRLGLICELHAGNGGRSYTVTTPEHHHHLICSNCRAVVAFARCGLEEMQQSLADETGFRIDDHLLEFAGLCPACQKEGKHIYPAP